jgi:PhnB protein
MKIWYNFLMILVNLFVPNCVVALDFYRAAYGALTIQKNLTAPVGERNARFKIGSAYFSISDENIDKGALSPLSLGGTPICIQLPVDDIMEWRAVGSGMSAILVSGVTRLMEQALQAGGTLCAPSSDTNPLLIGPDGVQFCNIKDPFGFVWSISRSDMRLTTRESVYSA